MVTIPVLTTPLFTTQRVTLGLDKGYRLISLILMKDSPLFGSLWLLMLQAKVLNVCNNNFQCPYIARYEMERKMTKGFCGSCAAKSLLELNVVVPYLLFV